MAMMLARDGQGKTFGGDHEWHMTDRLCIHAQNSVIQVINNLVMIIHDFKSSVQYKVLLFAHNRLDS